jgi:enoyl-CoA hydratase/carnithine racemase
MLTTGEFISAEQAKTIGLVNKVAGLENLEEQTEELANTIASKLGAAVKIGKEAFYKQLEMPIEHAYKYTGQVMTENMMLHQTEKGIEAFLNKLEPVWEQD